MDPPKDGDEDDAGAVVGGMVARLGLRSGSVSRAGGLELMEELGLGEGTRVVDLQVGGHFPNSALLDGLILISLGYLRTTSRQG